MRHRIGEWVQCHQTIYNYAEPPFWCRILHVYNMHMDVQAPGYAVIRVNRAACSQNSIKEIPT